MISFMSELLNYFAEFLKSVLPLSPFKSYISALESMPYLGYLNYFIPISAFIAIGQAWLIAIGMYYLYSIILRWIKAIG